jgi:hypothetical protein
MAAAPVDVEAVAIAARYVMVGEMVGSSAIYTPLEEVAVDGGRVLAGMDNGYSDSSPRRAEEARNFVRGVGAWGGERRTDWREEGSALAYVSLSNLNDFAFLCLSSYTCRHVQFSLGQHWHYL